MTPIRERNQPARRRKYFRAIILTLCLTAVGVGLAQITSPPANPSPSSLGVEIYVSPPPVPANSHRWRRLKPEDRYRYTAPVDIYLLPHVWISTPLRAGDSVLIACYANSNRIGVTTNIWHDEVNPSAHAKPGQAVPMFIIRAGFWAGSVTWSNAPPGNYTLTAKATYHKTLSAVSPPVDIVILPPGTNSDQP